MNYVKSLILKFDIPLKQSEITKFRGAVIAMDDNRDDILFHSHDGEELRYAYPLIQYKTIDGRAAIIAVAEGTTTLEIMTNTFVRTIMIGEKELTATLAETMACSTNVDYTPQKIRYSISNWMPLNRENYETYSRTDDLAERLMLLKRMLTGNILSFAKGIGLHLESELQTNITNVKEARPVVFKRQKMLTFNAEFTLNLRLPQFIGLGKGVSVGFGMIREIIKKQNNE